MKIETQLEGLPVPNLRTNYLAIKLLAELLCQNILHCQTHSSSILISSCLSPSPGPKMSQAKPNSVFLWRLTLCKALAYFQIPNSKFQKTTKRNNKKYIWLAKEFPPARGKSLSASFLIINLVGLSPAGVAFHFYGGRTVVPQPRYRWFEAKCLICAHEGNSGCGDCGRN